MTRSSGPTGHAGHPYVRVRFVTQPREGTPGPSEEMMSLYHALAATIIHTRTGQGSSRATKNVAAGVPQAGLDASEAIQPTASRSSMKRRSGPLGTAPRTNPTSSSSRLSASATAESPRNFAWGRRAQKGRAWARRRSDRPDASRRRVAGEVVCGPSVSAQASIHAR